MHSIGMSRYEMWLIVSDRCLLYEDTIRACDTRPRTVRIRSTQKEKPSGKKSLKEYRTCIRLGTFRAFGNRKTGFDLYKNVICSCNRQGRAE